MPSWVCIGFEGFSFRDCLLEVSGKMKFLSNTLASVAKPLRQQGAGIKVQGECSLPVQTYIYG